MKTIDTFISWGKSHHLSSNSFLFTSRQGVDDLVWSSSKTWHQATFLAVELTVVSKQMLGMLLLQIEKLSFSEGCSCCTQDPPQDQRHKRAPPRGCLVIPHLEVWQEEKGNIHTLPCFLYLRPMTGENHKECQAGCHQRNKSLAW